MFLFFVCDPVFAVEVQLGEDPLHVVVCFGFVLLVFGFRVFVFVLFGGFVFVVVLTVSVLPDIATVASPSLARWR